MKTYFITSQIAVDVSGSVSVGFDREADFNQIVLRVRKGDKYVNFRVTHLGDNVTLEFYQGDKLSHDICLRNDPLHAKAFQTLMDKFLA